MIVTEGVSGLWHYHLSREAEPSKGLCGASVMGSGVQLSKWQVPFGAHFPKKPTWCAACGARVTTATEPPIGACMNTLKKGDAIQVENGREEVLYRGKVLEVVGAGVRVKLAGLPRPFVFTPDGDHCTFDAKTMTIFTAW